jgi:hypothetical protein
MKIWSTKYVTTNGIEELEVRQCQELNGTLKDMVEYKSGMFSCYLHKEGTDWHRTRKSAVKRARIVLKKKIESHHKTMVKLDKLLTEYMNEEFPE